jgi:hypothetical protein
MRIVGGKRTISACFHPSAKKLGLLRGGRSKKGAAEYTSYT